MNEKDKFWVGHDYYSSVKWQDFIASKKYEEQINRVYDECVPIGAPHHTMPKIPNIKKESSWEDLDEAMLLIG